MIKKIKDKRLTLSVIVILVLISIIFLVIKLSKNNKVMKITTVKKSYDFVSLVDDVEELIVPMYINIDDGFILKKENINRAFITDEDEINIMKIDINDIEKTGHIAKIDDENYFCYLYKFNISQKDKIIFKNAFLRLDCNKANIKINIGSVTINKIDSFDNSNGYISITNLKGIINTVKSSNDINISKKDIFGIVLGIKNNSKQKLSITKIAPLDCNYYESFYEGKIIDTIPESNENMTNILGYEYEYFYGNGIIDNEKKLQIDADEKIYFLLPLKKISKYSSNSFGIMIEFIEEKTNKKFEMYIDDFLFFTTRADNEEYDILIYENY